MKCMNIQSCVDINQSQYYRKNNACFKVENCKPPSVHIKFYEMCQNCVV